MRRCLSFIHSFIHSFMAFVFLGLFAVSAHAATITINTLVDLTASDACSLRSAIASVNTQSNQGGCVAEGAYSGTPGSPDTITLPYGRTMVTTGVINVGPHSVQINAHPSGSTLDANGGQLFSVSSGATFILHGMIIKKLNSSSVDPSYGIVATGAGTSLILSSIQMVDESSPLVHNINPIYVIGGASLVINDSLIQNAAGFSFPNVIAVENGNSVDINRSTFSGNQRTPLFVHATPSTTISNSTFTENVDTTGTIIFSTVDSVHDGVTIINTTIVNNSVRYSGSPGINLIGNQDNIDFTLINSILANDPASSPASPNCSGTIDTSYNNIFGNLSGCTVTGGATANGNLTPAGDLGLLPLAVNLPSTFLPTIALSPASPALDAAYASFCSEDARGISRSDPCDIGAYEYRSSLIDFVSPTTSATEGDHVTYTLSRSTPAEYTGPITVNYSVNFGTPATGSLNWAASDTANKSFTVNIPDNTVVGSNPPGAVSLTLTSPSNRSVRLVTPASDMTIADNDIASGGSGGGSAGSGGGSAGSGGATPTGGSGGDTGDPAGDHSTDGGGGGGCSLIR